MQDCKKELQNLIRAKYPVIAITSLEERRIAQIIGIVAKSLNMGVRLWSLTSGFTALDGSSQEDAPDPQAALVAAMNANSRTIFVLRDFHPFLKRDNPANVPVIRQLKDVANVLRSSTQERARCIILLCPSLELPDELRTEVALIDWPLPTEAELTKAIKEIAQALPPKKTKDLDLDDLARAAKGLTLDEFENCLAKSLISEETLDKTVILEEKKKTIKKNGLLEIIEAEGDLDSVGGLENLKNWLIQRKKAFSSKAKAFGLPSPKGLVAVGQPGTGKSLSAKTVSLAWEMPELKLDVGSLFGSLLGESEANLRKALKIAESMAPCILFIDEIDKGLGGSDSSTGSTDGGTSSRILQGLLTWLQEKKSEVFVFVTANRVEGLPPELFRRGRFDDLFYVDLPNSTERNAIWKIHIEKRGRITEKFDLKALTGKTEGFSGAEIESCVVDAMFEAFSQDREFTQADLEQAISLCVPLSKMAADKLEKMRAWAKGRAKLASKTESTENPTVSRFSNLSKE